MVNFAELGTLKIMSAVNGIGPIKGFFLAPSILQWDKLDYLLYVVIYLFKRKICFYGTVLSDMEMMPIAL